MQNAIGAACDIEATDRPLVYVAMVGDILHAGHINILECARQIGSVIIGVLTDSAAVSYKRLPYMPFEQRKLIFENMKGIDRVVAQNTLSYRENLLALQPRYVLHGDDWREGPQAHVRAEVIEIIQKWGGEIVEIPYTSGVSSTMLYEALREAGVIARGRQHKLRALLTAKPLIRCIEVHSPLAAVIADRARVNGREFDAFWSSSLADSLMHGKPDIEVLDYRTRISSIADTFEVTSKPLIYDGDSGGSPEAVYYLARALHACGVSALCLEDKNGRKVNSLYGAGGGQSQASIPEFAARLAAARSSIPDSAMMLIARIESLVLEKGVEDAFERAMAYCDSGADGILIHSVKTSPEEVFTFAERFRRQRQGFPLFVVPTTFSSTYERELQDNGVNCVIYANHLLRAAYASMKKAANDILRFGRTAELSAYTVDPYELLAVFPEPKCAPR